MIYRVQSNIDYNVVEIIEKLKNDYDIVYYNGILYIAIQNINQVNDFGKNLKKYFKPSHNFLFTQIDENNLGKESQFIIDWGKNIFIRLDMQRFEKNNQEELKKYMNSMDELEKILQEKMREEVSNASRRPKEENKRKTQKCRKEK